MKASPSLRANEARRSMLFFLAGFALWLAGFSVLFQVDAFTRNVEIPMTEALARLSAWILRLFGFTTLVTGAVISDPGGFGINILKGCDGAYVLAIYLSAVFAFPSSWKAKALGTLVGGPAVQGINLARIVSLYWLGLRRPDLFESFHYHVWQSIVIILAMALWIAWAELVAKGPRA